jgi:hypothetical protein
MFRSLVISLVICLPHKATQTFQVSPFPESERLTWYKVTHLLPLIQPAYTLHFLVLQQNVVFPFRDK